MSVFIRCITVVMVLLTMTGCPKNLAQSALPADVKVGGMYYTQISLQYEKNRYRTTNYRRGVLLPINTQVMVDGISDETIDLQILPSHAKLQIENVEKHTGDTIALAFSKLLNKNKVDLSRFSALEKEKIMAGQVAKDMRKKAVLAAIGYPPITETPSLESNQWTYWSSRFDRFMVYFENDRVIRIKD